GLTVGDTCVYVLDATAKSAFSAVGTSLFTVKCGIIVNSSDPQAMVTTGSACVSASTIRIVGGWSSSSSCPPSPMPTTGVQPLPDPLASLQPPTLSSCNYTNFKTSAGGTINPWVYCGGVSLTGGTLTMNPGTYIMNGGGFSTTGGTVVQGNGVTIFNTGSPGWSYQPISIA